MTDEAYRHAFADWLACAVAGSAELAAVRREDRFGGGLFDDISRLGTAGHILDFDDTYVDGLSHLSAATAPVALAVASRLGQTVGEMLAGYADGFEAMARFSAASHPRLYDAGWHATAISGVVGASVTAARLMDLDAEHTQHALRLSLLTASGLRTAFGSLGKSIQVGFAAASGAEAARFAAAGATTSRAVETGPGSFADVYGGDVSSALDDSATPAIGDNWLKAYPCCLQTHGPIDAGLDLRERGLSVEGHGSIVVHPVSRQAAGFDDVTTGLEAKFSIPYTTAWAMLRGAPVRSSFEKVDDEVRALSRRIRTVTDPSLERNAAILTWHDQNGEQVVEVQHPRGSPRNPMSSQQRHQKVVDLGGPELVGVLDDGDAPAERVARVAKL